MGVKLSERFENHMDGIDIGTKQDARRINSAEVDDSYDDFDEKLTDAFSESTDVDGGDCVEDRDADDGMNDTKRTLHAKKAKLDGVADTKSMVRLPSSHMSGLEHDLRRTLSDAPTTSANGFTMNTPKTIMLMREQMGEDSKAYFDKQIDAGGGVNGQRAHLRGIGHEYYMTSSAGQKASGNFLTEDHPGETASARKENLQLPPENDASVVDKVVSNKPAVVLISRVAPQEKWAAQSGYEAKEGMKQVFTPNLNKGGAIEAGIYKIMPSGEVYKSGGIDSADNAGRKDE